MFVLKKKIANISELPQSKNKVTLNKTCGIQLIWIFSHTVVFLKGVLAYNADTRLQGDFKTPVKFVKKFKLTKRDEVPSPNKDINVFILDYTQPVRD